MKYIVCVAINGTVDLEVEADSFDEARDKAKEDAWNVESGEINIVGCDTIHAVDENGKLEDGSDD